MNKSKRGIDRRQFLKQSARGAGILATTGMVLATERASAATDSANPFAYDVERFARTDPRLIGYEELRRFPSPHAEPRRLALGPEDRLYLATKAGVDVLDPEGRTVESISLPSPARCVAVGPEGTIYAGMRDHIEVFDPKGRAAATWESPGKKTWLTGLSAGAEFVLAADSGNRTVLRYDRAGKLLGRIGRRDKEHNIPGLIVPSPYLDVKLAPDGLARVNNPGRHAVEVYTLEGELELSWGKPSAAIDGFCGCCNPVGLALLADGRCVTCEKGLPRVKVYAADSSFECVVAGPETFPENARAGSTRDLSDGMLGGLDAAADSRGRVYILDLVKADVRVMQRKA